MRGLTIPAAILVVLDQQYEQARNRTAQGVTSVVLYRSRRSLPEQRFIQTAQGDDGFQRAHGYLTPVRDGNRGAIPARQLASEDHVAASLVHEGKTVITQEPANLAGGEWPELRHGPIREAEHCRPASAGG